MSERADRYRRKLLIDCDTIDSVALEVLANPAGSAMHEEARRIRGLLMELVTEIRRAPRRTLYRGAGAKVMAGCQFIRRAMECGVYKPHYMTVIAGRRRGSAAAEMATEPPATPEPTPAPKPARSRPPKPAKPTGADVPPDVLEDHALEVRLRRAYRLGRGRV